MYQLRSESDSINESIKVLIRYDRYQIGERNRLSKCSPKTNLELSFRWTHILGRKIFFFFSSLTQSYHRYENISLPFNRLHPNVYKHQTRKRNLNQNWSYESCFRFFDL